MNTQQKRNGAFTSLYYGMIAALPMGALAMMLAPLAGMQFAAPLRLIASSLLGQAALSGATGLVLGLVLHMMTGAALGAVYAYLLGPGPPKCFMAPSTGWRSGCWPPLAWDTSRR